MVGLAAGGLSPPAVGALVGLGGGSFGDIRRDGLAGVGDPGYLCGFCRDGLVVVGTGRYPLGAAVGCLNGLDGSAVGTLVGRLAQHEASCTKTEE
jgi:hypothetical protein